MSDDIVTRPEEQMDFVEYLRLWASPNGNDQAVKDLHKAADEIERWQDIARRLYLFIQDPCTHNHWCDVCSSIDAYEKAVEGE